MLVVTILVALFKKEVDSSVGARSLAKNNGVAGEFEPLLTQQSDDDDDDDEDAELDAAEIGLRETYHRLYAVCKLPAVRWLFLILLTYRLPCALSDNVKFLKAVEFGLSKQTTAFLSPTIVLPLGILVPIIAAKIWRGQPLTQFMFAYKFRVTVVALVDVLMLFAVRSFRNSTDLSSKAFFWSSLVASTAFQATAHAMQFNAQMTFFAHRVDPAIGGSYMTLLNTFANLGGTWPSSVIMFLVGRLTVAPTCTVGEDGLEVCSGGKDAYFPLQLGLSVLGCLWIFVMGDRVRRVAELPDDAWRTHIGEKGEGEVEMEETTKGGKSA